jgi:hypothetical protein
MSNYYDIGPCDDDKRPLQGILNQQYIDQLSSSVIQQNIQLISTVMLPIFEIIISEVGKQQRAINTVLLIIQKDIERRIEKQDTFLKTVVQDLDTTLKNLITEQDVQLKFITSTMDVDQSILNQILENLQYAAANPSPPVVVNVQPPTVVVQPPSVSITNIQPTKPPEPVIITVPGPVQIVNVPVFIPCPATLPSVQNVNVNVDTGSIFLSSESTVGPIQLQGNTTTVEQTVNVGTTTSEPENPKPSNPPVATQGEFPVDLDTPLAFIFSPDDDDWKKKAIAFYGDGLGAINGSDTLDSLQDQVYAAELLAWGDIWSQ